MRRAGRMVSPTITAARPTTIVPVPMRDVGKAVGLGEQRAGERDQRVAERHADADRRRRSATPWARAMRGLAPVARMARP